MQKLVVANFFPWVAIGVSLTAITGGLTIVTIPTVVTDLHVRITHVISSATVRGSGATLPVAFRVRKLFPGTPVTRNPKRRKILFIIL